MTAPARWLAACGAARRTLLGLWFGSVTCFSFFVAPTLFRVIRAAPSDRASPAPNALAGDVVVPTLQKLAWVGLVAGLMVIALMLPERRSRLLKWRVASVGLGLLSVLASMTWLMPTMLDLLAQMNGPVDALAETHPVRVAFNNLHGMSSAIHLGMLLGPLFALILEPGATPRDSSAPRA